MKCRRHFMCGIRKSRSFRRTIERHGRRCSEPNPAASHEDSELRWRTIQSKSNCMSVNRAGLGSRVSFNTHEPTTRRRSLSDSW